MGTHPTLPLAGPGHSGALQATPGHSGRRLQTECGTPAQTLQHSLRFLWSRPRSPRPFLSLRDSGNLQKLPARTAAGAQGPGWHQVSFPSQGQAAPDQAGLTQAGSTPAARVALTGTTEKRAGLGSRAT